jgi:ABC-2 type transport system permease protein
MTLLQDTYTMWLREVLRYKRNWRYLIFQFIFPLIIIVIIGFGLGNIVSLGKNLTYIDFLSSGFLVFMIANGALGGGFNLIEERNNGFLKEVIVAPISRASIILGKIAGRITLGTLQVIFLVLVLSTMANLGLGMFHITLLSLILMTVLFVCIGVILASYFQEAEVYRTLQGLIIFPLMFISGIFFPIDKLPAWLKWIAFVNPVTYAVDLFRYSVLGTHAISLWTDVILLLVLSTGTFFLAVWLFDRKFRE